MLGFSIVKHNEYGKQCTGLEDVQVNCCFTEKDCSADSRKGEGKRAGKEVKEQHLPDSAVSKDVIDGGGKAYQGVASRMVLLKCRE